MRTGGIYLIIHVRSGKVYVGQSTSFALRWKKHREDLDLGLHHNHRLQKLWFDDGSSTFEFRALHFLPDGLSALARQRWLVQKETVVWEEYRSKDLALNIVRPELVATPAALSEYKVEQKTVTSAITNEMRGLKPQIEEAKLAVRSKLQESFEARQEADKVAQLLKRNTGWRGFLFGKTTTATEEELKRELETKQLALRAAEAEKEKANSEAEILAHQRAQLYRAYPGNVDRRLRRTSMYSGTKRRTTIR